MNKKDEALKQYKAPYRCDNGYMYDANQEIVEEIFVDVALGELIADAMTKHWGALAQPEAPQAQPVPLTEAQDRADFEAFVCSELGDVPVMDNGRYISPKIQNYWRTWQEAARQSTQAQPVQPLTDEQEREAFEAWCHSIGLMKESYGILSVNSHTETAWSAWQARAAVAKQPPVQPREWVGLDALEISDLWLDTPLDDATEETFEAGQAFVLAIEAKLREKNFAPTAHGIGAQPPVRESRTTERKPQRDTTNPDIQTIILQAGGGNA